MIIIDEVSNKSIGLYWWQREFISWLRTVGGSLYHVTYSMVTWWLSCTAGVDCLRPVPPRS